MTSKEIAEQLGATGLCICPDFLSAKSLHATADDLDQLHSDGKFHSARVGRGAATQGARSDETFWLDRDMQNSAQGKLWTRIDLLLRAFNRTLFLGLSDFEGHYATYGPGGFYERHRDCHLVTSNRVVSLIIYLNRDWVAGDGGCLRLHEGAYYQDVDPVGGTMVCFMSRDSEHEVLLNRKRRLSFTGWFLAPASVPH